MFYAQHQFIENDVPPEVHAFNRRKDRDEWINQVPPGGRVATTAHAPHVRSLLDREKITRRNLIQRHY